MERKDIQKRKWFQMNFSGKVRYPLWVTFLFLVHIYLGLGIEGKRKHVIRVQVT
jgi:hypothetical protein